MRVVPLEVAHLDDITVHPKQPGGNLLGMVAMLTTAMHRAWSALDGDDLIVLGGYIGPLDDGEAAWLLFTDRVAPRHFVWLVRVLRGKLAERSNDACPLYIDADPTYPAAERLSRLLGFSPVRTIAFPDGRLMTRMVARA